MLFHTTTLLAFWLVRAGSSVGSSGLPAARTPSRGRLAIPAQPEVQRQPVRRPRVAGRRSGTPVAREVVWRQAST